MRLKQDQKKKLLEWAAEGLRTDEINQRAALLDDPFQVTRAQVQHYRRTRKVKLEQIKETLEDDALSTGLALRSVRVAKLQQLAGKLEEDLFEKDLTWVTDIKGFGHGDNFQTIEVEKFNASEVSEYRAILDQISGEVGDKKPDQVAPDHIHITFGKPDDGQNT